MLEDDWIDEITTVLFEIATCLHVKKRTTFTGTTVTLSETKRVVRGEMYKGVNPIVSIETTEDVLYDVTPLVPHVLTLLNEETPFIVAFKKDGVFRFVKWTISHT